MTGAPAGPPVVDVLGIRHHGPGSARAVRSRLDELRPDLVLVEGPSDADPLLAFAAMDTLEPPVALLAYAADAPRDAAFWPFAVFSPEWQAIAWAVAHDVPVRFCDLPASASLVRDEPAAEHDRTAGEGGTEVDAVEPVIDAPAPGSSLHQDPIAMLALASAPKTRSNGESSSQTTVTSAPS